MLAPLAVHIPLAALAAILFVVAWNMSDARHVVQMVRRAPRADVVILLVTLLLTVFADLVVAVNVGVLLAMLQFLRRMACSVEVRQATEEELGRELAHSVPPPAARRAGVHDRRPVLLRRGRDASSARSPSTHTDPRVLVSACAGCRSSTSPGCRAWRRRSATCTGAACA